MLQADPILSVVVCTRNRSAVIPDCLFSLDSQETDYSFEIVVVDNASKDNTSEVIYAFAAKTTLSVIYVYESRLGLSYARNKGYETASGRFIAYIDDDVIVSPHWAQAIIEGHLTFRADCIAGRVLPKLMAPEPSWLARWEKTQGHAPVVWGLCDFGNEPREMIDPKFVLPGQNMSIHRRVFEEIGLFNTQLGRKGECLYAHEDQEISCRARDSDYLFYYIPDAFLWHKVPSYRMTRRYILKLAWDTGVSASFYLRSSYSGIIKGILKAAFSWLKRPELYFFKNLISRFGHLWGKLIERPDNGWGYGE